MLHCQLSTGEWWKNITPNQIDSTECKKKLPLLHPQKYSVFVLLILSQQEQQFLRVLYGWGVGELPADFPFYLPIIGSRCEYGEFISLLVFSTHHLPKGNNTQ